MQKLIKDIRKLQRSSVKKVVEKRLREFQILNKKNSQQWFSELCFCILTANWKAKESIEIQNSLGYKGFFNLTKPKLESFLKKKGHRFYPQRADYIHLARKHSNIKLSLGDFNSSEAREWIVKNIKGLAYKESSHFLRNVGYIDLAILDRHILNLMHESKLIKEKPKTLTKKRYLAIEKKFISFAYKMRMTPAELDLYMWYLKTGKVLK